MSQSEKYYSVVGERSVFRITGDKEILKYEFDGHVPEGTTVSLYVCDKLVDKRPFKRCIEEFPVVKIYNEMVMDVVLNCAGGNITCTVWYENSLIWEDMGEQYVDFLDWKRLPDYTFTELILGTTWKDTVNAIFLVCGSHEETVWKYDIALDVAEILPNRVLEIKNAVDYSRHMHYKRLGDGRTRIIMPVGGKRLGGYEIRMELDKEIGVCGLRKINYGYGDKGFYVREL